MKKAKIVLVGIGGYGNNYPTLYIDYPELYAHKAEFVAVVDPFAEKAPKYDWIREKHIPVFGTLDDFYRQGSADLAVISTPIALHKGQALTAVENGSHVLCEKPLTATVEDTYELIEAAKTYGRKIGVGFQWSYTQAITRLKSDIIAGKFGAPLELKVLSCEQRCDAYYASWKGKIKTDQGDYILDSIVTNASSHYLHNLFYVLGDTPSGAAMPDTVSAEVYRAKEIESFDTVVMKGSFSSGATFWFGATHSNDKYDLLQFIFRFEKADICFNMTQKDDHMYAVYPDGKSQDYGELRGPGVRNMKFGTMIDASLDDRMAVPCTPESVLPHVKVCNGLFSRVGITTLPSGLTIHTGIKPGTYVEGLCDIMERCFRDGLLFHEAGVDWAAVPETFSPGEITRFEGVRYLN